VKIDLSGPIRSKRLATFSPGTVFGEVALLDKQPRSATVTADEELVLLRALRGRLRRADEQPSAHRHPPPQEHRRRAEPAAPALHRHGVTARELTAPAKEGPWSHATNAVPLVETAKALRPRILAERARIETARRLPDDLAQELARAGFFRIFLPAAYGGLDLPPTAAAQVFEELSRRPDASVAWCVWNGNTYWTTARWPKEVGQALFADPNMILANSTRPSGRAEVVEGGYRLSGRWSLVSKCQISARPSRCARPRTLLETLPR
jgi:alkylation response protein AidB-like acyl-CoA dehydrogenase